jgi:hexosaminidase
MRHVALFFVGMTALQVGDLRAASQPELSLMPLPYRVEAKPGGLKIDNSFLVVYAGYTDARLKAAVERFVSRLSRQTGIPLLSNQPRAALTIECKAAGPPYPTLGEDEAYRLDVTPAEARLSAATTTGILRGLETLLQLAGPGETGMRFSAVHIEDRPRFPWRGLMLDVSRHWMPLPVVLRNLDAMAAVKLNVFHWHLSDDQGFRVESKVYPRLQQFGSDGLFYTQEEVRRVVTYARDRGIRVIPEFDIPGHTSCWFAAYPELASAPGLYSIERTWGTFTPVMDPAREQTYAFLSKFIAEMAALFPDPDFHIGGDEVDDTQWKASKSIQAFEKAHNLGNSAALHAYFNRRLQTILARNGKTMIGWDEILVPGLDSGAIVQSWRGAESLSDAARKGHRALLSAGYYLDHLQPASEHYAIDPLGGEAAMLTPAESALILGGEACMWTEYASSESVDSRIWPRMAAISERFWSPVATRDPESMYRRLEPVSRALEFTGITHRANPVSMLDRLAGYGDAEPVRVLAHAVESLGIEGRRDEHKYSSPVPLNRLVDAAAPESELARHLSECIRTWLATRDEQDLAAISQQFAVWMANPAELRALAHENYLVTELFPLSETLAESGKIGTEALAYLKGGVLPPDGWVASRSRDLDLCGRPKAETKLAAVRPVRLLLEALAASGKSVGNQ